MLLSLMHPLEAVRWEWSYLSPNSQQTNRAQKGNQPSCLQLQSLLLAPLPLVREGPNISGTDLVLRGEVNISEGFEVLKLYPNPPALGE